MIILLTLYPLRKQDSLRGLLGGTVMAFSRLSSAKVVGSALLSVQL